MREIDQSSMLYEQPGQTAASLFFLLESAPPGILQSGISSSIVEDLWTTYNLRGRVRRHQNLRSWENSQAHTWSMQAPLPPARTQLRMRRGSASAVMSISALGGRTLRTTMRQGSGRGRPCWSMSVLERVPWKFLEFKSVIAQIGQTLVEVVQHLDESGPAWPGIDHSGAAFEHIWPNYTEIC